MNFFSEYSEALNNIHRMQFQFFETRTTGRINQIVNRDSCVQSGYFFKARLQPSQGAMEAIPLMHHCCRDAFSLSVFSVTPPQPRSIRSPRGQKMEKNFCPSPPLWCGTKIRKKKILASKLYFGYFAIRLCHCNCHV